MRGRRLFLFKKTSNIDKQKNKNQKKEKKLKKKTYYRRKIDLKITFTVFPVTCISGNKSLFLLACAIYYEIIVKSIFDILKFFHFLNFS